MSVNQQTLSKLYWDLPLPSGASLKILYEGSISVDDYNEFMSKLNAIMPIVLETIFAASSQSQFEERALARDEGEAGNG